MLNTTLLLPFPNKSAEPYVSVMSPGFAQSARLSKASQSLKELLLLAFCNEKYSIDFLFISLTFIYTYVNLAKVHEK